MASATPDSPFLGRLVLVTGATSGIGLATVNKFSLAGAIVVATGRNEAVLADIENEAKSKGRTVHSVKVDVTDDQQVADAVSAAVGKSADGHIDVLVNCAGVLQGGAMGDDTKTTMANWDFNMNTNARGLFCFMTEASKFMKRDQMLDGFGTSAIVNISSVNGLQSFGGVAAYCASKAAVDMLTDCAAVDLAPYNIRVNAVNPGVVVTNLQKRGGLNDEAYAAFLERSKTVTHPLANGRLCQPEEVAEAIYFLADPTRASFSTGTHLTVDGGRRCLGAR